MAFLNNITAGKIKLEIKNLQEDFNEHLKRYEKERKVHPKKKPLANINMLLNERNEAIKFIVYCL